MQIVLVGHGSIGSRYKQSLIKHLGPNDNLYIVDNNDSLLESLRKDGFNCFKSISEITSISKSISHGIVANWGPDHVKTAHELIDIGCKRLIIEKPVSSRIDELIDLKKRCNKENIFVTVHHHWNYTDILNIIKESENKFDIGDPVGIRFIGGAVCLSTNGTHYFDLGCSILKSIPKQISADLELDYINPRSEDLVNIGGMASYKMKNGTFIHASFSNQNSQAFRTEIVYRHAIIEISTELKIKCFKRKSEDILKFGEKITRYGDLEFLSDIHYKDISTIDLILENLFNGINPTVSIEHAETSLLMVLGAIESHLSMNKVQFDKVKDTGILIS